jgi:hypothetical protein
MRALLHVISSLVVALALTIGVGLQQVAAQEHAAFFEQAKLLADDTATEDNFGDAVAIDEDTVIVGASSVDVDGTRDQGAAYVFTRAGAAWTETARLTAIDGAEGHFFGASVVIEGDTAVVGAPGARAAYVFTHADGVWTQTAKLTLNDFVAGFGTSLALSGRRLVVGANTAAASRTPGEVYVFFASEEEGWAQTAKLVASDGAPGDGFGAAVAVAEDDTLVVGAITAEIGGTREGAVYVFTPVSGSWTETKLTASDGTADTQFGRALAIDGDTLVVGTWTADLDGVARPGAAYVFARAGDGWTETGKLMASDGVGGNRFGTAVALADDTAVVGAFSSDGGRGAAYAFTGTDGTWTEAAKLVASDGASFDWFGSSVAADGDTLVIGAPKLDFGDLTKQGAAYVFLRDDLPPMTSIDLAPAAPDGLNGWYVSAPHITVSATDEGGAGVADVRCDLNPSTPPTSFAELPSSCPFQDPGSLFISDGHHVLYAASVEHAGNESPVVRAEVLIDRTPPTVACLEPAPLFPVGQSGATVWAGVSDAASGPLEPHVGTVVSTASPGTWTVSLTGQDAAGHATTVSCPYTVDEPRTLTFFLHGAGSPGTADGFTMSPEPPSPQPLTLNLLGGPSWYSDSPLNGIFLEGGTFELVMPCTLGISVGKTVRLSATNADGGDEYVLGETSRGLSLCLGQETIVVPVTTPVTLIDQRLKLTISSTASVGVNLRLGSNTFLRGTRFIGAP